jgi:hypothetical protein
MIHIICIKLKLVKLDGCTCVLKQQTVINRGKNINGGQFGNYPFGTIMPNGFCNVEH